MTRRYTIGTCVAVLLIGMLSVAVADTHADTPGEYTVKGAFLYNFLKYVEWEHCPDSLGAGPLVIAIAGHDPFGSELDDALQGRTVHGRDVRVIRFQPEDTFPACHLLFTVTDDPDVLMNLLHQATARQVLTVGECDRFLSSGGVISLDMDGGRVRFDVNISNARASGLFVSAKLLKLARCVLEPDGD